MTEQSRALDLEYLLPSIPSQIMSKYCSKTPLSPAEKELLKSYSAAASNASVPVLLGIEAIGKMIAYTDVQNVGDDAIHNLGWLIASLGRQAQSLKDLEACANSYLHPQQ